MRKKIFMLAFKMLISSTLWASAGTIIGYQVGNQAGFRRGVHLTVQLVLDILNAKQDDPTISIKPYRHDI